MMEVCTLDVEELDLEDDNCYLMEVETAVELQRSSSKKFDNDQGSLISVSTNIGRRQHNLDTVTYSYGHGYQLMALFDGHSNSAVSNYLAIYLLETLKAHPLLLIDFQTAVHDTFQVIDSHISRLLERDMITGGSTAIITLVTESDIFVANLGDSKAITVSNKGEIVQLNNEHNLSCQTERREVINRGGTLIKRGKEYRLDGEINLSRSFGDFKHKPAMSSIPQIKRFSRDNIGYIVMGSDGFWNEVNPSTITNKVFQDSQNTAEMLMQELCKRPSDNATVICWKNI